MQGCAIGRLRGVDAVHVGDRESQVFAGEEFEFVASGDGSFLIYGEIEAGAFGAEEMLDDAIVLELCRELEAGKAGRGDSEDRRAETVAISDEDGGFAHADRSEIFAECSPGADGMREFGGPRGIVFGGVSVDGFVGAAVDGEIGLAIAVEIGSSERNSAIDWIFEDAGLEGVALPSKEAREADVEGNQVHIRIRVRRRLGRCRFLWEGPRSFLPEHICGWRKTGQAPSLHGYTTTRQQCVPVALPIVAASYRIKSLLDCTASRKRVSSS